MLLVPNLSTVYIVVSTCILIAISVICMYVQYVLLFYCHVHVQ